MKQKIFCICLYTLLVGCGNQSNSELSVIIPESNISQEISQGTVDTLSGSNGQEESKKQEEKDMKKINEASIEISGGVNSDIKEVDKIAIVPKEEGIGETLTLETSPESVSLKERLTALQYEVTQNAATEPPYKNEYWDVYEPGIYVDIIDGMVLFSSTDKFDSQTGWPSFTDVISQNNITEKDDTKLWFKRTEILAQESGSHLGHLFYDGPKDQGGLRYCINSASLRFIPKDLMSEKGYQNYLYLFE